MAFLSTVYRFGGASRACFDSLPIDLPLHAGGVRHGGREAGVSMRGCPLKDARGDGGSQEVYQRHVFVPEEDF
jgi:hypothetical protein